MAYLLHWPSNISKDTRAVQLRADTSFMLVTSAFRKCECEGEVAVFSAKRWDRRNRADLIESATPCHDAQVVRSYRGSSPLHLTVLASKSEDYITAPQHLQIWRKRNFTMRLWALPGIPNEKSSVRVCQNSIIKATGNFLFRTFCQWSNYSKMMKYLLLLFKG